ncbi:MAG: MATE family efflux transporter [Clostridia bacterium]|nr:MATE family efflux transporter [Clostridia bacterium]MBR6524149.1 MATE family efflux transporter [Clostridia bacterium]
MKPIYKSFFLLMVPMALKELIAAFINLLDSVMLGSFGKDVIAAVGIANQWFFLFSVVVFGVCGGAGVFASQYWGARNISKMRKVLGLNIILVAAVCVIFFTAALTAPEFIIGLFRKDAAVVEYGAKYLRIACFSYLFAGLTSAYDISLCCSERASIPFASRAIGLLVNLVMNQILIFGMWKIPAMGVEGAAIATIIARATELFIILGAVYGKKLLQAAPIKELFSVPVEMLGGYFKAAVPVIVNEGAWAIGTTVYSWVFSQISTDATVIMTIVQNVERLLLVFFHGGGNATGILVGKMIGSGEYDKAYNVSKRLCIMNSIFSLAVSALFVFVRPIVLMPYNITPEVYAEALNVLFLMACLMNIKSLTFLFIVGIFRNGGDPKTAALIDIGSVWLVGVPSVCIAGLVLKLPITQIYIVMMIEEVVKVILSAWWFKSKKWMKNLVV